ncbi:MAG: DnaD domain protein [Chloroflexi bacterium]|nr:DnaD domain protein [Chloroflexota bacterium]
MAEFDGFRGKMRLTRLPDAFFTDLLGRIDDLDELKVTLYFLWRLERMEGAFRALSEADLAGDAAFTAGLSGPNGLRPALERAVGRGTLLAAEAEINGRPTRLYLLNSERGRAALAALESGQWRPDDNLNMPAGLDLEKPNIFRLYEEHIGALTPMIAEALAEAERDYPAAWVEDAVRIAVSNNVRKWRYVEAILERWQREGRDDGTDRGRGQTDPKKYTEGEFSEFIER